MKVLREAYKCMKEWEYQKATFLQMYRKLPIYISKVLCRLLGGQYFRLFFLSLSGAHFKLGTGLATPKKVFVPLLFLCTRKCKENNWEQLSNPENPVSEVYGVYEYYVGYILVWIMYIFWVIIHILILSAIGIPGSYR